jgi:hypothetical protein
VHLRGDGIGTKVARRIEPVVQDARLSGRDAGVIARGIQTTIIMSVSVTAMMSASSTCCAS